MKNRIGKISVSVLFSVVLLLLAMNLVVPNLVATPINPRAIPETGNVELPGDVWYVDGNKSTNSGDGKSWSAAYNLLSTALAASHADIARTSDRQWAGRNTIYVKGNSITEDLTALAQKTDIIGVGSFDAQDKASLIGTIAVASTVNYMSCRFYNMSFQDDGAGGVLVDVDGQTGLQFIGCLFLVEATDTVGLKASDSSWLKVKNCFFGSLTSGTGFSTACIVYDEDNPAYGVTFDGNYLQGEVGIDWNETTIGNVNIINNQFRCQAMVIDTDDLAGVEVYNNFGTTQVSEADNTGSDFNQLYGGNNVFCGTGGPILLPAY